MAIMPFLALWIRTFPIAKYTDAKKKKKKVNLYLQIIE